MKHRHKHAGGRNRQVFSPEGTAGSGGKHRHQHGRGGGRRGGRSRLFDYGEIRLLVLKMISEKPTYGYELIKDIEEKFGGSYTQAPALFIQHSLGWKKPDISARLMAKAVKTTRSHQKVRHFCLPIG